MILLAIGKFNIYVWGAMVNVGFLVAAIVACLEAKRKGINPYDTFFLAVILYLSGLFGAWGLNYLIYRNTGFMFIGGAIFALFIGIIYAFFKKLKFFEIADIAIIAVPFGMFFGRLGCMIVNDHLGSPTKMPWAINIEGTMRHPVILYLLINITILIILLNWLKYKIKKRGILFLIGVLYYSATRFFLDFFRCSDMGGCDARFSGLTITQWSLLAVVVFLVVKWYIKKVKK